MPEKLAEGVGDDGAAAVLGGADGLAGGAVVEEDAAAAVEPALAGAAFAALEGEAFGGDAGVGAAAGVADGGLNARQGALAGEADAGLGAAADAAALGVEQVKEAAEESLVPAGGHGGGRRSRA